MKTLLAALAAFSLTYALTARADAPDWDAVDAASDLAAAETDAALCRREAEVTAQDARELCARRAAALEKLQAELDATVRENRARFEREFVDGRLTVDEYLWLEGAQRDLVELAVLRHVEHLACWADGHNLHRNRGILRQFKRLHPCPGGPDAGSTVRCRGWQIDHVCPLACCGRDAIDNLQWLTAEENRAKSDDCGACRTLTKKENP